MKGDAHRVVGPYIERIAMRFVLRRAALVLAIAGIAILCLSSGWLAAAIGLLTAVVVLVDTLVFSRPEPDAPPANKPRRLNVDLTRRR